MRVALLFLAPVVASAASCASPVAYPTNTVGMRFERAVFYDAPFPSDDLLQPDGSIAIAGFPNLPDPDQVALVDQMKQMVASTAHGFAQEGAVYFSLGGAAHPINLPDVATSVTPQASVFLMSVTAGSPDYLQSYPVTVRFNPQTGPFGVPDMLTLLPLQGTPLRPKTTYAAVVTSATGLDASDEMASIASGIRPPTMTQAVFDEYWGALGALQQAGVAATDVAGLSVYTTDDPTAQLGVVLADMLSRPLPAIDSAFHRTDLFDTYCVYEATLPMPDYKSGEAPYTFSDSGGGWQYDASGKPIVQRTEEAGVVVSIPRAPMPASGWPVAHFIRTGGGTNRPLVDRGPEATNGGDPIAPGTGPALWFAKAGLAGAMVDGPHEDSRNLTSDNEDFLMFNINNLEALRDNVRESAAEYALFAHILAGFSIDVSDCPGTTGPATFDASRMALMGHSMGATIAPLVLAIEPMYKAVVLSGAGASWIENIIWKQLPTPIRPFVNLELRYNSLDPPRNVPEDDPVLTLFQWAAEPADPLVYTRTLVHEPAPGQSPRQVLMEQGIVDHYILPPIANATSLSLGLDLAGPPLDASSSELLGDAAPTLESVIAYSGRRQLVLPVSGNQGGGLTGVVVQHPSDGIEDGHEMVFQTDPPKREYRCFLQTWAAGQTPLVPLPGDLSGPCE
ncbi:MAG: alpha/beta hydrolase family protein [Polyangiaceae bacterium]